MLTEWSRDAQINTDRNLRLQYLAGMALNSGMANRSLAGVLEYYRFPDKTFFGSPEGIQALKQALNRVGRTGPRRLRPGRRRTYSGGDGGAMIRELSSSQNPAARISSPLIDTKNARAGLSMVSSCRSWVKP